MLDNLGKGASGAAVQNLNIMLGLPGDGGAGLNVPSRTLFAVDDVAVLQAVLRRRVFVTFAALQDGALRFAYAPIVVDPDGRVRFHLAMRNPLASLEDGARVSLSALAADAYVSPDWYRTIVTVPTWNYIAVEGEGTVRRLPREELRRLLADLSAQEEQKLAPKPAAWTIDKVPPGAQRGDDERDPGVCAFLRAA